MCVLHRAKGRSFKTKRPKRDKGKNRTRKNGNPPMEGKPQRKDEHSIQCMYWSLQFSNIPLIDLAIIREPGLDFPKISQSVARCQSRRGRLVPAVPRNMNRIKAYRRTKYDNVQNILIFMTRGDGSSCCDLCQLIRNFQSLTGPDVLRYCPQNHRRSPYSAS